MSMAIRRSGKASASASRLNFPAPTISPAPVKAFIAALMPKHPLYIDFLSDEARAVIGSSANGACACGTGKEGFRFNNYIDIFDGGPTLECEIDRVRAIRKSRLLTVEEGQPAPESGRSVWSPTSSISSSAPSVHADPDSETLLLSARELDTLKCHPATAYGWSA